ncbi:hypothetical protein FGO68_gene7035 [Halteria grandinella]|uniref:Uncharacterized protein n=1 Tax=Halteria grandinella TaxID=5974 RepID=A0A8J8NWM8_HALGN|nr:hypothetical protein FGO68_gene7035 [Halteria grandinella]
MNTALNSNMMLYPSRNFEYQNSHTDVNSASINLFHPSLGSDMGAHHAVLMQNYARKIASGKGAMKKNGIKGNVNLQQRIIERRKRQRIGLAYQNFKQHIPGETGLNQSMMEQIGRSNSSLINNGAAQGQQSFRKRDSEMSVIEPQKMFIDLRIPKDGQDEPLIRPIETGQSRIQFQVGRNDGTPSLANGKTRQIDVYTRSFSRVSGGNPPRSRQSSYNISPTHNKPQDQQFMKPSKSLSLNRMAVRHQSRNPNQATTFHVLAPAQQEKQNYYMQQLYDLSAQTTEGYNTNAISKLLLQRAKEEYLQRANQIKKNEVSDLLRLNKLHRMRNLKEMLTEQPQSDSQSPSRGKGTTSMVSGTRAALDRSQVTFSERVDETPLIRNRRQIQQKLSKEGSFINSPNRSSFYQKNAAVKTGNVTFLNLMRKSEEAPLTQQLPQSEDESPYFVNFNTSFMDQRPQFRIKTKKQPNYIDIARRLFEIKKNKNKVPPIDFALRLDSYHSSDTGCLHCRKDVLSDHMYVDNKTSELSRSNKSSPGRRQSVCIE